MNIKEIIKQLKIILAQLRLHLLKQKITIPNLPRPKHIVVHYGAGNLDFDGVNRYHEMRWGFKSSLGFFAGYHWFLQTDCKLFQARADNERGAHCVEPGRPGYWNENAIGVGVMGDNTKFTEGMKNKLKALLDKLKAQYGISYSEIYGHKDISPTVCPGSKIYDWLKWYKNQV